MHQFEKIEQFTIVAPETSIEEHERMLQLSEEFYQSLGLSYRVTFLVLFDFAYTVLQGGQHCEWCSQ